MVIEEIKENITFMILMRIYCGYLKSRKVKYLGFHDDEFEYFDDYMLSSLSFICFTRFFS
jgi:hypothetical protein